MATPQIRLASPIEETESVHIPTPSGGLDKGQVYNVAGTTWGFAFGQAETSESDINYAERVLIIVKAPVAIGLKGSGAIGAGVKLYWDNSAKVLTTTEGSNPYFGICRKSALSADTEVEFVFDGTVDL